MAMSLHYLQARSQEPGITTLKHMDQLATLNEITTRLTSKQKEIPMCLDPL